MYNLKQLQDLYEATTVPRKKLHPDDPRWNRPQTERNLQIIELFKAGCPMTEIADEYGTSRQRIHQIIQRAGLSRKDGGQSKRAKINKEQREYEKLLRFNERHEVDWEVHKKLRSMHKEYWKCPLGRWYRFKRNCGTRKIELLLTLTQWWGIWEASGHWEKYGNKKGHYVLGRIDLNGPYSLENSVIREFGVNSEYYYIFRDSEV